MTYQSYLLKVGRQKLDALCYVIVIKQLIRMKQVINYNLFGPRDDVLRSSPVPMGARSSVRCDAMGLAPSLDHVPWSARTKEGSPDPSPTPFSFRSRSEKGLSKPRLFYYLLGRSSRKQSIFGNLIKKIGKFWCGEGGWGDECYCQCELSAAGSGVDGVL